MIFAGTYTGSKESKRGAFFTHGRAGERIIRKDNHSFNLPSNTVLRKEYKQQ